MSLKQRRLDKGWSQEDLALHTGLSARTIQRIETGKRASLESLKCLAAVFETSVQELVEEQSMTQSPETKASASAEFDRRAEENAIAYVQNVKAFHLNWVTCLITLPVLYLINRALSPEFWWVLLVAGCWALAIVLHAVVIFSLFSLFDRNWEHREFQKRLNQIRN